MTGRSSRARETILLWVVLGLCVTAWVLPQRSLDFRSDEFPETYPLLFLPSASPAALRASSLGFQTIVADVVYLWSIQYYSRNRTDEGRRYLWQIYDVITNLDTHFVDAYSIGALVMSWDMGDTEMALDLLDKGIENNPDEWILPVLAGFYCYEELSQYERAADYFEQALEIPEVPDHVSRLRAGMYEFAGNLEDSLEFWADIHDETDDERVRSIAWQHVADIRVALDLEILRDAIDRFRADRGTTPRALAALLSGGYLRAIPVQPDGAPYTYNPVIGTVDDPRDSQSRRERS